MAGFFTGLNDYQKEVDEDKKYKEAFKLKQDAFDLSLEKFELDKETLAFSKQKNRDDNFVDMAKIIQKQGGYGASGGYGSGPKYDTSGKYMGENNAHYSQQIITEFPNIDKASVAKVMAATNLSPDVGYRMYTALTTLRNAKANKQLSEEDLSSFFNQVVQTEVSPNTSFSDIDATDVSPYLTDLLSEFQLGSATQTTFPTAIEEKDMADVSDNKNIEGIVYNVLDRRYETEVREINKVIGSLTSKEKDPNQTLTAEEISLRNWMILRQQELGNIKGYSSTNPNDLFKLYGSQDTYKSLLPQLQRDMDVQFPDNPLLPSLQFNPSPVTVQNASQVYWLRDNGFLQVGQKITLIEPIDGRYNFTVPPKK